MQSEKGVLESTGPCFGFVDAKLEICKDFRTCFGSVRNAWEKPKLRLDYEIRIILMLLEFEVDFNTFSCAHLVMFEHNLEFRCAQITYVQNMQGKYIRCEI